MDERSPSIPIAPTSRSKPKTGLDRAVDTARKVGSGLLLAAAGLVGAANATGCEQNCVLTTEELQKACWTGDIDNVVCGDGTWRGCAEIENMTRDELNKIQCQPEGCPDVDVTIEAPEPPIDID